MSTLETSFDAVIGFGANLGDRAQTLVAAARELRQFGRFTGLSALYETVAIGPPQPAYLNGAARLLTEQPPEMLLETLLGIERLMGRVRRERWGPRTLDLDILWIRGVEVSTPGLQVPHPELERRAFALLPLLDVAPEAESPRGVRYEVILASLDRSGVRELPGTREGWEHATSSAF